MTFARLWLLLLCVLAASTPASAQPSEIAVKAVFIPRFARYIQWPDGALPGPREPVRLCVVGRDPFGALLDQAASREEVDGRPMAVHRTPDGADAIGCHLAYVRGATARETERLLLALRTQPTLTITDSRAGPARGMIHFQVSRGRVRFFIDEAEAHARGLAVSSRLLALALGVRQRRP